jgi:hypothetical protein
MILGMRYTFYYREKRNVFSSLENKDQARKLTPGEGPRPPALERQLKRNETTTQNDNSSGGAASASKILRKDVTTYGDVLSAFKALRLALAQAW